MSKNWNTASSKQGGNPRGVVYKSYLSIASTETPTKEAELKRTQIRRSTGWRSKATAPYRCLGTPDLELEKPTKKHVGSDGSIRVDIISPLTRRRPEASKNGEGRVVLGEAWTSEQSKVARLRETLGTQRAEAIQTWMKKHPAWVDEQEASSEQPYVNTDYDDTTLRYLQSIDNGVHSSRKALRDLRVDVKTAELRLKRCRAGSLLLSMNGGEDGGQNGGDQTSQAATAVSAITASGIFSPQRETQASEPRPFSSESHQRVPKLPLSDLLANMQHHGPRQTQHAATSRKGYGGEATTVSGEFVPLSLNRTMTKNERIRVILGHSSIAHPARDLGRLCREFESSVVSVNAKMTEDLAQKKIERNDVIRRKFRAFKTSKNYFTAQDQLECMRLEADRDRLQTAVRLFQNRQWYTKLMQIVVDDDSVSEEEQFILSKIKRILEEGVIFTKDTIHQLVLMYKSDLKRVSSFDTDEVQGIFEFLCDQFDVDLLEYDRWIVAAGLPVPAKTTTRSEQARQRRIEFFDNDVMARHWHDKFDILESTKPIKDWFPAEVVEAIEHRVAQPPPNPPPASTPAAPHFHRTIVAPTPSRPSGPSRIPSSSQPPLIISRKPSASS